MKANQGKHPYIWSFMLGSQFGSNSVHAKGSVVFQIFKWAEKVKTNHNFEFEQNRTKTNIFSFVKFISKLSIRLPTILKIWHQLLVMCPLSGSLSLGLTHLIQLPLLLISSLNSVVYKNARSSQASRSVTELQTIILIRTMRIACVHRMTDYKTGERLGKRCPNENIQKNQKWVPWSLQINIKVVSYCLTLHENGDRLQYHDT